MTVADGRVHLRFHDKVITVPGFAADEIRHLLEADDCRVDQLPGSLDDDGRIVLVRRLVKEGLLTVRRWVAAGWPGVVVLRSTER